MRSDICCGRAQPPDGLTRDIHVLGLAIDSFTVLFVLRLLLGCGESVAYPRIRRSYRAVSRRVCAALANAAVDAGSKVGPALGVSLGVELVNKLEWRGMFIGIGGISLLWLIPWCFVAAEAQAAASRGRTGQSAAILRDPADPSPFGAQYSGCSEQTTRGTSFSPGCLITSKRNGITRTTSWPSLARFRFGAWHYHSMLAGLVADGLIRRGKTRRGSDNPLSPIGLLGCCLFMLPAVLIQTKRCQCRC